MASECMLYLIYVIVFTITVWSIINKGNKYTSMLIDYKKAPRGTTNKFYV